MCTNRWRVVRLAFLVKVLKMLVTAVTAKRVDEPWQVSLTGIDRRQIPRYSSIETEILLKIHLGSNR